MMKADAVDLEAKSGGIVPKGIHHYYILSAHREKFANLRKILAGEKPEKCMVFLNNPENIEVTVDKLNYHGIKAAGIYGQASKQERKNAMDGFREGRIHVLVASDIGSRGLDIEGVTHIINLDVPEEPTHYLHRAGRCGRKGMEGTAITIVTPYERKWIHRYEKTWGLQFEQKEMSFGKLVDSQKTKKDIIKPMKAKKPVIEDKWVEGDGWGEFDDLEDFGEFVIETGGVPKKSKKKKAKEQPFSMAKTPKKQGKKGKKTKQADDSLGFFAQKSEKTCGKRGKPSKKSEKVIVQNAIFGYHIYNQYFRASTENHNF